MLDAAVLLLALQNADGQFPGGGFAFSWGLEGLLADGQAERRDLADLIEGQLRHRWSSFDRPILVEAHKFAADARALSDLEALVEAWSLAAPQREGSRRAGTALLGMHARLGTPGTLGYHRRVQDGRARGHLAVVQGVVWRGVGLPVREAQAMSAYCLAAGLAMAALRLGAVGHVDAQAAIAKARRCIVQLLMEPPLELSALHAFTPIAEIAMLRHAGRSTRLFSN